MLFDVFRCFFGGGVGVGVLVGVGPKASNIGVPFTFF